MRERVFIFLRPLFHLFGVRDGVGGIVVAADEARHFVRVVAEQYEAGERLAVFHPLFDEEMAVRHRGERRHMRDGDDLPCAGDVAIPEPSDILPYKWAAWLAAIGGAVIVDGVIITAHYIRGERRKAA